MKPARFNWRGPFLALSNPPINVGGRESIGEASSILILKTLATTPLVYLLYKGCYEGEIRDSPNTLAEVYFATCYPVIMTITPLGII